VQNFAKTARTNFVKTAVNTLETAYVERAPYKKKLETAKQKPVSYVVSADVKALFPSLYRNTVTKTN